MQIENESMKRLIFGTTAALPLLTCGNSFAQFNLDVSWSPRRRTFGYARRVRLTSALASADHPITINNQAPFWYSPHPLPGADQPWWMAEPRVWGSSAARDSARTVERFCRLGQFRRMGIGHRRRASEL